MVKKVGGGFRPEDFSNINKEDKGVQKEFQTPLLPSSDKLIKAKNDIVTAENLHKLQSIASKAGQNLNNYPSISLLFRKSPQSYALIRRLLLGG